MLALPSKPAHFQTPHQHTPMQFDDTKGKLAKVKADPAAARINKLHKECCAGMRTTLEKAIEVGKLLIAQKAKCGHGKWTSWIEKNLEFAERTARQYINCHKNQAKLKRYPDTDLTLVELARIADEEEPKAIVAELVKEPQIVNVPGQEQPLKVGGAPLATMRSMLPVQKYLEAACQAAKEQGMTGEDLFEMLRDLLPQYNLHMKTTGGKK